MSRVSAPGTGYVKCIRRKKLFVSTIPTDRICFADPKLFCCSSTILEQNFEYVLLVSKFDAVFFYLYN